MFIKITRINFQFTANSISTNSSFLSKILVKRPPGQAEVKAPSSNEQSFYKLRVYVMENRLKTDMYINKGCKNVNHLAFI